MNKLKINLQSFTSYQKKLYSCKKRILLCKAAPQIGKTESLIPWLMINAAKSPANSVHWWITPNNRQCLDAMNRMGTRLRQSPLEEGKHYKISIKNQEIIFMGAGKIAFLPAENIRGIYGITVHSAVVDEIALIAEESWNTILTRFGQTGGDIRAITNVHGKNWFTDLYDKAEKNEDGKYNDYATMTVTVDKAIKSGVVTKENINLIKKSMSKSRFQELYYCVPRINNTNAFGLDSISSVIINDDEITDNVPIVFGVDLAKSFDFSCCVGFNSQDQVVFYERWQAPWNLTKHKLKQIIGEKYALVDSSGVGDPILEDLQKEGMNVEGFKFNNKSKGQLIDELVIAVQQRQLRIKKSYKQLIKEMENFEVSYTQSGLIKYEAGSGHDDTVIALALAWKKHKNRPVCSLLPFLLGENVREYTNSDERRIEDYNWQRI